MPQLNPDPWFVLLTFSWLVFLVVLPPKVLAHMTPNHPVHRSTEKSKTEPWAWPWH
uniref:ATP synthase complex subunit 8 n=1 Tax=Chrysiptera annulata TaxID=229099 RepID=Q7Y737_9TELE|nr:ATP synthase 8 [Chrysiptera annulata]AAP75315.1 ATP synthase 8 [Chrysiptera annulata]